MADKAVFQVSPGGKYRQGASGDCLFPVALDDRMVSAFLPYWQMEGIQFALCPILPPQATPGGEAEEMRHDKTPAQRLHASGLLAQPEFHAFLDLPKGAKPEVAHEAVKTRLHLDGLSDLTEEDYKALQSTFLKWKRGQNGR